MADEIDISRADLSREEQITLLRSGVVQWNAWRQTHRETLPDLSNAGLAHTDLSGTDLSGTDLILANLIEANLRRAILIDTSLVNAVLDGCQVYGISAWDARIDGAKQTNLSIARWGDPAITVDNLQVAQFLYLPLDNQEIRAVIDTLTSKIVLLLGRFSEERKPLLDALRVELRQRGYVPVLFDFPGPESRDTTETITLLARMARFVVADVTDPCSLPLELQAFVPDVQVPVQCLILDGQTHFAMFADLRRKYRWVLPPAHYLDLADLLANLQERVIALAEQFAQLLAPQRADASTISPEQLSPGNPA